MLAFLPGRREIERTTELLCGPPARRCRGDAAAWRARRQGAGRRDPPAPRPARARSVLATAIAETSITIDGVRVVVDCGLSRLPKYEPATGLTRLETVRVSRASADQRAGRAGRTGPGVAIRLWRAEQTAALAAFTPPEILEADLSGLVLDCAAFGVADPGTPRLPRPAARAALAEARALLVELGALDRRRAADATPARRCGGWRCRCGWRTWWPRRRRRAMPAAPRGSPCCSPSAGSAATTSIWNAGLARLGARPLATRQAGQGAGGRGWLKLHRQATPTRFASQAPRARSGGKKLRRRAAHPRLSRSRRQAARRPRPLRARQRARRRARRSRAAGARRLPRRGRPAGPGLRRAHRLRGCGHRARDPRGRWPAESCGKPRSGSTATARRAGARDRAAGRASCSPIARLPAPSGAAADRAVVEAVRRYGLSMLPWDKAADALRARLAWLHRGLGAAAGQTCRTWRCWLASTPGSPPSLPVPPNSAGSIRAASRPG